MCIKVWNIFKEKMTLIADLFPKLRTPENVVRYMSKKSNFKGPFARQHVKLDSNTFPIRRHSTVTIFTDHLEGN